MVRCPGCGIYAAVAQLVEQHEVRSWTVDRSSRFSGHIVPFRAGAVPAASAHVPVAQLVERLCNIPATYCGVLRGDTGDLTRLRRSTSCAGSIPARGQGPTPARTLLAATPLSPSRSYGNSGRYHACVLASMPPRLGTTREAEMPEQSTPPVSRARPSLDNGLKVGRESK